ncbi:unnamed protein product (macronuclear) [Paramecium tetraurelia]|uniref:Uncharacterized protein n=1 Tax=Paramecium tetraurelia TaxID=5888 RepID=A0CKX4_PARTE|nr:uncharacterized protein GSPATT00007988001 [Paramecium tetraurelia]CAK71441.1 unnamed protein product [Paramecium tetraurelia]|eukprot:XP_001438838.1 hypothetical protein (macronuclear) [Paramecium tetraurelia strain d4-2]
MNPNPIQFNPPRSTITSQVPQPGPNIANNSGFNTIQNKNMFPIANLIPAPSNMPIQGINQMQMPNQAQNNMPIQGINLIQMPNQAQNPIFKTQDLNQKEKDREKEEIIKQLNIVVQEAKERQDQIKQHYQKHYD